MSDQPAELTAWEERDDALHRTVTFDGYRDAVAFTMRVAIEAEVSNHHPDLALSWGRVDVSLTSHDVGGVTDRDREMAQAIEAIVATAPTTD